MVERAVLDLGVDLTEIGAHDAEGDEDKAKYDERTKVLADKMFIPKEKRALVW